MFPLIPVNPSTECTRTDTLNSDPFLIFDGTCHKTQSQTNRHPSINHKIRCVQSLPSSIGQLRWKSFFLLVWSPWPDSLLIIWWFFQAHSSGYPVTILCTLLVSVLLSPSTDGSGPPLSPPSDIPPELLVFSKFARACISLSSSFLLSIRLSLSAVRPYDWLDGGRCQSQRLNVCWLSSPTWAAGGPWLGCGWGVVGDGAPRDGLDFLDASTGVVRSVGFSRSPDQEGMPKYSSMC